MEVYEVVNEFDMSRYYVVAKNEQEMLDMVDESFVKKLKEITDDDGQYDDLREDREERMDCISYELLVEDASKSGIHENPFEGDEAKFY